MAEATKRRSPLVDFLSRLLREKPLGAAGAVIVVLLFLIGIFAEQLAPYDYAEVKIMDRLAPPSAKHWLGADQLGRDVLSRVIHGARISVIIGLMASLINLAVAMVLGITTGFFGGKFDLIVMRIVDAWLAIPVLLILMTVMSLVGRGLLQIIVVLGIASGIGSARIPKSAVMAIKENQYMLAAKAIGVPTSRILIRHVMPNIMAPLLVIFSTSIGGFILWEAALSFLGFGLPPDVPSWGGMLSGEGRKFMEMAPGLALWPGLALTIVVWGANVFGDAMPDLLDPRLRGNVGRFGLSKKPMKK